MNSTDTLERQLIILERLNKFLWIAGEGRGREEEGVKYLLSVFHIVIATHGNSKCVLYFTTLKGYQARGKTTTTASPYMTSKRMRKNQITSADKNISIVEHEAKQLPFILCILFFQQPQNGLSIV